MIVLAAELPDLHVDAISDPGSQRRALEAGGFDLVITDYQLGWTDGLVVLREVKARCPECPVIMFTGSGSEELAVAAMKAGLDEYILKPKHLGRRDHSGGAGRRRCGRGHGLPSALPPGPGARRGTGADRGGAGIAPGYPRGGGLRVFTRNGFQLSASAAQGAVHRT